MAEFPGLGLCVIRNIAMKIRSSLILLLVSAVLLISHSANGQFKSKTGGTRVPVSKTEVAYSKAAAISDGRGVLLKWETSFENKNLGFEIFRTSGKGWEKIGPPIVPGSYLSIDREATYGRDYRHFDPEGGFGAYYLIRAHTLSGQFVSTQVLYPSFSPNFALQAGSDSSILMKDALSAEPVTEKYTAEKPAKMSSRTRAASLVPDLMTQHWVAAQPGVKIGIKNEGIYRVSRTDLQNAGFDVNTDETLWQLYLDGNEQAIIVEQNGDYIEFYGRPIDTRYTNENIYFLVVGASPGLRMADLARNVGAGPQVTSYRQAFYRRDRSVYVAAARNGEKENFFGAFLSSSPSNVTFTIDEIDYSNPKASVQIGVQGYTTSPHNVTVNINGVNLGKVSFNGSQFVEIDAGVPTSLLIEGLNTVTLATTGGQTDLVLVEYVQSKYKRNYVARSDELSFSVLADQNPIVGGFTSSDIRLFDVTAPDAPKVITNAPVSQSPALGASYEISIPADTAGMMVAVTGSALRTPNSIVSNTPSTLSSAANGAVMVIISNPGWLTEAGQWASYRTNSGIDTVVVDVTEVFDEFNYGRPDSNALREFINYARLNWNTAPQYIMLLGDGSYDPRNYTGNGFRDYVPTGLIETTYDETPSDEYLADHDDDGLSEVSIGRVPARTAQEVTDMLAKVTAFESTVATAPARGSMCASDLFQIVDFAALCERVMGELPESVPHVAVNRGDVGAKTTLVTEMNAGKYITNYAGHGSRTVWAASSFFGLSDVGSLTNGSNLTIYTMLTCNNGYFVEPVADSLAERLVRVTNGAAVATWASSATTTPDVQELLATRFYNQLGNNPSFTRIGDLVKDAKIAVVQGRDVRLSWTLFGDPTTLVK